MLWRGVDDYQRLELSIRAIRWHIPNKMDAKHRIILSSVPVVAIYTRKNSYRSDFYMVCKGVFPEGQQITRATTKIKP